MQNTSRRFLVAMILLSCTTSLSARDEMPWAFNAPRAEGYSIDLVSIDPAPGTPLEAGTTVEFRIKVSYTLTIANKGTIILVFQDDKNRRAKGKAPQVFKPVSDTRGTVELTDTVTVPKRARELRLFVPLSPEGLTETTGEITIRYPIKKK